MEIETRGLLRTGNQEPMTLVECSIQSPCVPTVPCPTSYAAIQFHPENVMDPNPPMPGLAEMVDMDPEEDSDNNDG